MRTSFEHFVSSLIVLSNVRVRRLLFRPFAKFSRPLHLKIGDADGWTDGRKITPNSMEDQASPAAAAGRNFLNRKCKSPGEERRERGAPAAAVPLLATDVFNFAAIFVVIIRRRRRRRHHEISAS